MEPKKIKIKKIDSGSLNPAGPPSSAPKTRQDNLKILEGNLKKLSNRFNQFGYNDSKEEEFLLENRGKSVVLEMNDRKVEGILDSIDKYRISIIINEKKYYYYKHACIGYYAI